MSFAKEVKFFLNEENKSARSCCKEAFEAGLNGEPLEAKCKRCAEQYIAGTFCSCGTMSNPEKGFQLFLYPSENAYDSVLSVLNERAAPKVSVINGKKCIYYKSYESVGGFLAYCKATPFAIRVFECSVVATERARIQRECNADIANLKRATAAAEEQLSAIKILRKYNMIDSLKKELREVAELREANPEAALSELVSLSNFPVSKSGLNSRLKKLITMAKNINTEEAE